MQNRCAVVADGNHLEVLSEQLEAVGEVDVAAGDVPDAAVSGGDVDRST